MISKLIDFCQQLPVGHGRQLISEQHRHSSLFQEHHEFQRNLQPKQHPSYLTSVVQQKLVYPPKHGRWHDVRWINVTASSCQSFNRQMTAFKRNWDFNVDLSQVSCLFRIFFILTLSSLLGQSCADMKISVASKKSGRDRERERVWNSYLFWRQKTFWWIF